MWKADPSRLKMTWNKLNDGKRPVMQDCYGPSKFEYFENQQVLEDKIFKTTKPESEMDVDLLLLNQYNPTRLVACDLQTMKPFKSSKTMHSGEEDNRKLTDEEMEDNLDDDEEEAAVKLPHHSKHS